MDKVWCCHEACFGILGFATGPDVYRIVRVCSSAAKAIKLDAKLVVPNLTFANFSQFASNANKANPGTVRSIQTRAWAKCSSEWLTREHFSRGLGLAISYFRNLHTLVLKVRGFHAVAFCETMPELKNLKVFRFSVEQLESPSDLLLARTLHDAAQELIISGASFSTSALANLKQPSLQKIEVSFRSLSSSSLSEWPVLQYLREVKFHAAEYADMKGYFSKFIKKSPNIKQLSIQGFQTNPVSNAFVNEVLPIFDGFTMPAGMEIFWFPFASTGNVIDHGPLVTHLGDMFKQSPALRHLKLGRLDVQRSDVRLKLVGLNAPLDCLSTALSSITRESTLHIDLDVQLTDLSGSGSFFGGLLEQFPNLQTLSLKLGGHIPEVELNAWAKRSKSKPHGLKELTLSAFDPSRFGLVNNQGSLTALLHLIQALPSLELLQTKTPSVPIRENPFVDKEISALLKLTHPKLQIVTK